MLLLHLLLTLARLLELLLLGSLFVLGRLERTGLARRNLWLLLPVGFFATMVFVRANAWLTIHPVPQSMPSRIVGRCCRASHQR